jgi:hypothetical protein
MNNIDRFANALKEFDEKAEAHRKKCERKIDDEYTVFIRKVEDIVDEMDEDSLHEFLTSDDKRISDYDKKAMAAAYGIRHGYDGMIIINV